MSLTPSAERYGARSATASKLSAVPSWSRYVAWRSRVRAAFTCWSRTRASIMETVVSWRSQVRERLARMGLAPQVAIQDLPRHRTPAEPEGQRQREDESAEGDPERDEHHLLADS